ncbi:MAG TPA: DUF885 domain-containing protein, partial [Gemmatimonadaceae bacterium]|nr:DUF885 domain-containing protein [Gemmatimonadaceae bacterium]
ELLGRLRAVDRGRIATRSARVLYDTEAEMLGSSVQSRVCRSELWPASQMFGWQTMYPMLAQMQPVGTADLRAQALARWRQLPRYVDTEIANLREGLREGYSTPAVTVERVIGQLDGLVALAPEKSPFYSPALRDSTPEFRAELARVVANDITPAARRYRDFLKNEYLPKARTTVALSDLPNGEQCYRALVRASTTLDVEPRAVHELGLKEMDRIEGELRVISKRSFGGIDNRTLLARLRDDPKYTFKSREEMLAYARDAVARAKAAAPKWFGILPKADVVVEPYPEFQEKSAPGGEYMQPAEDGSRPGIYRINTYQPEKQAKAPVQSTAFHEAIPGHHLQLAIAQELPNTHRLQRLSSNSGFTEGWALYAERLSDEMGLFSSDLDRVGLLSNEALRAARLVVDPGLHVLGWTRQQAIDYMLAHTAESPEAVATEVDRYIVMPGQATSYMLGRNEIMSLRDEARRELGSRFEIREFHDRVLEDGSVTLPALRVKIEQWIAAKKQAAATR